MRRAAHIAVVHLNNAGKHVFLVSLTHSGANPEQKIPCRFVTDAQRAAQLNGRNAAFVRSTEIDRPEPDRQRQMRAVHDCPGRDGGLMPAARHWNVFRPRTE